MNILKNVLIKYLESTTAELKRDQCELTEEQIRDAIRMFAHKPLSKEQACQFMHLSRGAFDTRITKGYIPRGRKRLGFKELVWYEDELEEAKINYRNQDI